MFDIEKIYTPLNLKDALSLYTENESAVLMGGGNSFYSQGYRRADVVISLADIPELRCIFMDADGNLIIGAATTFTDLAESPLIRAHIPALSESVWDMGSVTFRNTATLGGNLCKKQGVRETTACLSAYEALVQLEKGEEKRLISLSELYAADGKPLLEKGEILTAVIIEKASLEKIFGSSYRYVTHNNRDKTLMCCSANLSLTPDGMRIERLRLCYVCDSQPPRRLSEAEILAEGSGIFPADISPITAAILHSIASEDGGEVNHEFIVHLVRETAKMVITHSIELAKTTN